MNSQLNTYGKNNLVENQSKLIDDLSKIKEESFGIREIIKNNSESIIRFKTTDFSSNIDINTSEDYELFHNRFFNI